MNKVGPFKFKTRLFKLFYFVFRFKILSKLMAIKLLYKCIHKKNFNFLVLIVFLRKLII